ncbi:MAG: hypothetical protein AAGG75_22460 [Bacteroidota bacterium]
MKTAIQIIFSLCLTLALSMVAKAQVAINDDGAAPAPSAMLDVSSTDKGVLIPRMTTNQRNNISNPATGLMVYDNDQNSFWYFNGTAWTAVDEQGPFVADNGLIRASNTGHDFVVGDNNLEHSHGLEKKLFFDRSKAAFRAGEVSSSAWDESSLGNYSFATGRNTTASGSGSTAMGFQSIASGHYSLATGYESESSGYCAVAMGYRSIASGDGSVAFGGFSTASGSYSTAFGNKNTVAGSYAIAAGYSNDALSISSIAFGYQTEAIEKYSFASGRYVTSPSYGEIVMGLYNTAYTPINANVFHPSDRLFVIGNGTSQSNRSDAMIVYKSGDTKINGDLEVDKLKVNDAQIALNELTVSNVIRFGPANKFQLDQGSWQTGNIALTSGNGTFGFHGTGGNKLSVRTDGNLTVDGALNVGNGTNINKIVSGKFNAGHHGGSGVKTVTINFGTTFSSVPKVVVTPVEGGPYNDIFVTTIKSVNGSSVTVNIYRIDALGAGWGQQLKLDWMAWN